MIFRVVLPEKYQPFDAGMRLGPKWEIDSVGRSLVRRTEGQTEVTSTR